MKPLFIVIEGIDGAGKTTQVQMLARSMERLGQKTLITCEPSKLPVGGHIRDILEHRVNNNVSAERVALLFAADRLEHLESEIIPALESGVFVISDRYTLSSVAYQGILTGSIDWVREINRFARIPDLLFYIDLTPEEAAKRRKARWGTADLYETDNLQSQVAQVYQKAARKMGAIFINGSQDAETLAQEIWNVIAARLGIKTEAPIDSNNSI